MNQKRNPADSPERRYAITHEWRYTRWGCVKHLVNVANNHTVAVCGVAVWTFGDWHGTGNQDEYDTLARFEECRHCHNRIRRKSNT